MPQNFAFLLLFSGFFFFPKRVLVLNCQHCVKCVQIQSFFCSIFSRMRTECREILRISLYSVRMRENTDQKNSVSGYFSRSVENHKYIKLYRQKSQKEKRIISHPFLSYLHAIIQTPPKSNFLFISFISFFHHLNFQTLSGFSKFVRDLNY